jgi:HEAT repeat protein
LSTLIAIVRRLSNFIRRQFARQQPQMDAAPIFAGDSSDEIRSEFAATRDPALIPQVAREVFARSSEAATGARNAITAVMSSLSPDVLPSVEEVIRAAWRMRGVDASVVEYLRESGNPGCEVLGAFSFHPNGYVREAAVRRLATLSDEAELRYLLLRLNDWVPQVRAAARAAVLERTRAAYVSAFARNFPLLERAVRTQRDDLSSVVEPLTGLMASEPGQTAMLAAMASGSRFTARAAAQFLIHRVPSALARVVAAGVHAADPTIRGWVTPLVMRALPSTEALPTLQRLASDSSPVVRRDALDALARGYPDDAQRSLERAVLDVSASVRETARFLLRPRQLDLLAMYRAAMSESATPRRLASAIAGLAEVGTAADAHNVAPYLSHPNASVRRAAVKAVMRLAGDAFAERILTILNDPSGAVSAASRDALRRHAAMLGRSSLSEIITKSPHQHARRNAVHLLSALPKWQSITALIQMATAADDEVAALARRYIVQWVRQYNRSQTAPSRSELAELTAALAAAGTAIDRDIVAVIRFSIRPFA